VENLSYIIFADGISESHASISRVPRKSEIITSAAECIQHFAFDDNKKPLLLLPILCFLISAKRNEEMSYAFVAGCIAIVPFVRIVWVFRCIRRTKTNLQPLKTLVILGSGGHTTEILQLTKQLNRSYYAPLEYCRASTDTTSVMRLPDRHNAVVHTIPRAREVGQSYVTSLFSTLYAQWHSFFLIAKIRPGLILCNGPGTVVPLCVAALFWRVVGWCPGQIVFVESYCRVQTLSLTGKLLYPWADLFVVHWEELHRQYPRSKLVESFVRRQKDK
jgi:beta-1,4-N-acetylglucosaminyltransferase